MHIDAPIEIPWKSGAWTNLPVAAEEEKDGRLVVTAAEGSDAWRHTCYGFVHDDEHALLEAWDAERAVEVSFLADYDAQFDQAGMMIRVDDERWIKTGVEFADGALQLGAVVTDGKSDWSTAPVPEWVGREVTIRATRMNDAVVIRARAGEEDPWRLVRLAPLDPDAPAKAGPYCCAPSRAGLAITFTAWHHTEPDSQLH
jgi:regulation of enolase protein 1 (concanavalin A-like superfamily)